VMWDEYAGGELETEEDSTLDGIYILLSCESDERHVSEFAVLIDWFPVGSGDPLESHAIHSLYRQNLWVSEYRGGYPHPGEVQ